MNKIYIKEKEGKSKMDQAFLEYKEFTASDRVTLPVSSDISVYYSKKSVIRALAQVMKAEEWKGIIERLDVDA